MTASKMNVVLVQPAGFGKALEHPSRRTRAEPLHLLFHSVGEEKDSLVGQGDF